MRICLESAGLNSTFSARRFSRDRRDGLPPPAAAHRRCRPHLGNRTGRGELEPLATKGGFGFGSLPKACPERSLARMARLPEERGDFSEESPLVSEALAVASAFCIALSAMLLAELSGRMGLLRLARWQLTSAFLMTGVASALLGGWRSVDLWQVQLLAASSLFGIVIASTTYFASIYAAGPRMAALLFSLTSPFALALGYVTLGETISRQQALGVGLVLGGVLIAVGLPRASVARVRGAFGGSRQQSWLGIALGIVTAFGQALGNLLARPAMTSGVEPFTAMAIRSGLAAVVFIGLAALPFGRSDEARSLRDIGLSLAAAFFGTCLGMSLLMAALKSGEVGLVSTLSALTPVMILPMVWVRSGERPPANGWAGALLAVVGTALISLT